MHWLLWFPIISFCLGMVVNGGAVITLFVLSRGAKGKIKYNMDLEIRATSAVIRKWIVNPERRVNWNPDIVEFRMLDAEEEKAGHRTVEVVMDSTAGRPVKVTQEITLIENSDNSVKLDRSCKAYDCSETYSITWDDDEAICKVSVFDYHHYKPFLIRIFSPLLNIAVKSSRNRALNVLKILVEDDFVKSRDAPDIEDLPDLTKQSDDDFE